MRDEQETKQEIFNYFHADLVVLVKRRAHGLVMMYSRANGQRISREEINDTVDSLTARRARMTMIDFALTNRPCQMDYQLARGAMHYHGL